MDAALSVANHPGSEFNPLTITAETGQGKTHLLNAIANKMRADGMNVICLTGEEFVDSFVKSSRSGNVASVRDRYRDVDALLIDGIERLIGKTGTPDLLPLHPRAPHLKPEATRLHFQHRVPDGRTRRRNHLPPFRAAWKSKSARQTLT